MVPYRHELQKHGIIQYPVHFKILAAGQQLRGNALPVFQHPKGLLRLCAALQVRHIQRLVDVQLPLFAVLAHTVIIVQAVGQVGVFLNFGHQCTGSDGMDKHQSLPFSLYLHQTRSLHRSRSSQPALERGRR